MWNNKFKEKQSMVYNCFKDMINNDKENDQPIFKEVPKSRKFFQSTEDVERFWKSLWTKQDEGNPNAEWLKETEEVFATMVPEIDHDDLITTPCEFLKNVKKKRNWSSPGPDLIVNFWLKKLTVTHELTHKIFHELKNKLCRIPIWFSRGRTALLEKPGEWAANNTRPITCTNNQYKFFTSLLTTHMNTHLTHHQLMQTDQRGAKEKCPGTHQNLLIDDMVLKDARDHQKSLATAWIDVRKAYDSVSHKWLVKCMEIHRFPEKLVKIISFIIDSWSVNLVIPLEQEDVLSETIKIINGLLQGDSMCGNLFTLSLNPVAWEIRRTRGYVLSKPISVKITHLIFIDDLKVFASTLAKLIILLSDVKRKMEDAGLHWNTKKCNFLEMLKGIRNDITKKLTLEDGSTIDAVASEEAYKFLGVPEAEDHVIQDVMAHLTVQVKQRSSIVWSSPLSDYNKILATNVFVLSPANYYMWSEKMNLTDLRNLDIIVREAINRNCGKYKLQMNSSLYLPRCKGGRGMRSFESMYKETKVKATMRLATDEEERMVTVKNFDLQRKSKNRSSLIKDGIMYASNDFDITMKVTQTSFEATFEKNGEQRTTDDKKEVTREMKASAEAKLETEIFNSTWQGRIFKIRHDDEHLVKNTCYNWLTKWRDCPVNVINDIQSIHLQTVPTLTFTNYRSSAGASASKLCRLCKKGDETVKHLLSNCEPLAKVDYIRRHNRALQCILFPLLLSNKFIEECPPWYSKIIVQPRYENEELIVLWDIPEYSGDEDEGEDNVLRPDGKLVFKQEKKIVLLEMSVPWIENRELKIKEKEDKYKDIVTRLKVENPGHSVVQATFIIDVLGGYSAHLKENIAKVGHKGDDIERITVKMQKIVLSEASYIVNKFKMKTLVG